MEGSLMREITDKYYCLDAEWRIVATSKARVKFSNNINPLFSVPPPPVLYSGDFWQNTNPFSKYYLTK